MSIVIDPLGHPVKSRKRAKHFWSGVFKPGMTDLKTLVKSDSN